MCVLYVSFGSKVVRRTFGCVAMSSVVLFICLMSKLLLYSAGSGVNRLQFLSGFSVNEVPLSMSLLGFVMGTMLANFHVCGIMLLLRAGLNMLVWNASQRRPMCFR